MHDQRGDVSSDASHVGRLAHVRSRVRVADVVQSQLRAVADDAVFVRRIEFQWLVILQPLYLFSVTHTSRELGCFTNLTV